MSFPVSSDPVNEMARTSGWATSAAPASSPVPWTRFTTPGGTPDSSMSSTSRCAQSGVSSAGFRMTQLPASSAGHSFHVGIAIGKFHGVMSPTMPIGWRTVSESLRGSSEGTVSPTGARDWPAMKKAKSMPSCTSPRASLSVLPISRVISRASSSFSRSSARPMRRSRSPRRGMGVAVHSAYAALAAETASATSSASLRATSPRRSVRSAGLRSSMVRPARAGTHCPPM